MILHSVTLDPLKEPAWYFFVILNPDLHKIMRMYLLNNEVSLRFAFDIAIELPFL